MPTVEEIAKRAFDRVARRIPDAIKSGELFEIVTGAHDAETETRSKYREKRSDCRCVFSTQTPARDLFPDYVQGPGDELVFMEGLSTVPQEGWVLCIGEDFKVVRAQDVLRVGAIAWAVVRKDG